MGRNESSPVWSLDEACIRHVVPGAGHKRMCMARIAKVYAPLWRRQTLPGSPPSCARPWYGTWETPAASGLNIVSAGNQTHSRVTSMERAMELAHFTYLSMQYQKVPLSITSASVNSEAHAMLHNAVLAFVTHTSLLKVQHANRVGLL